MPVHGNIQHSLVGIENVLDPVTMVDVKVQHQHALDPLTARAAESMKCVLCCNGYVIEKAEACGVGSVGMVTRRAAQRKSICDLPLGYLRACPVGACLSLRG